MKLEECRAQFHKFLATLESQTDREVIHSFMAGYNTEQMAARAFVGHARMLHRVRAIIGIAIERQFFDVAQCMTTTTHAYGVRRKAEKESPRIRQRVLTESLRTSWEGFDFNKDQSRYQIEVIGRAVKATEGNLTLAAVLLKIQRTTLTEKMKKLGITVAGLLGEEQLSA